MLFFLQFCVEQHKFAVKQYPSWIFILTCFCLLCVEWCAWSIVVDSMAQPPTPHFHLGRHNRCSLRAFLPVCVVVEHGWGGFFFVGGWVQDLKSVDPTPRLGKSQSHIQNANDWQQFPFQSIKYILWLHSIPPGCY